MSRPLVATYRVQLEPGFDFAALAGLAGYLCALGVSHAYLSPMLEARTGSTHGYDVVDPTQVRAELGGRAGLEQAVATLHDHGLGAVADIVPNHLAADARNPWWWSVLRDGPSSTHAAVFDIDWDAGGGRVLLPVLGAPLADVLAAGHLTVERSDGETVLAYFDRRLPLAPGTDPTAPLPDVLAAQHYRLTDWRAPHRNVRRFFDIDDLLGVRVEDPAVFDATHALVLELVRGGAFDAVRVDHVDGLRDPHGYLERLTIEAGVPVLVEKVLAPDEALPADWPVAGTTGYEHLADLDALFADPPGLRRLESDYASAGGTPFPEVDLHARTQVLHDLFPTEWAARASEAETITGAGPESTRDAVAALTLGLDVYRTYLVAGRPVGDADQARLERARAHSRRDSVAGRLTDALSVADPDALGWAARWQQLSAAVMAKGHEDTAYYRHTRLLALNEVGGDPDGPLRGDPVERFHARQRARLAGGRAGLTTTTTHDTKRSEDARARLLALTETPGEFATGLAALRTGAPPDLGPDELRLVAQTLLASWPLTPEQGYGQRVARYLRKALREAKRSTSWRQPDEAHEAAVIDWATSLLADGGAAFDSAFGTLRARLAVAGAVLSLTRVVLKHAAPGVPDLYRGCERWALDLADPDNRRPVDHARDAETLAGWAGSPPSPRELRTAWPDGRVKLWCTWRTLTVRRDRPDLFLRGAYEPLGASGEHADALIGFQRGSGAGSVVALGARRVVRPAAPDGFPLGAVWDDTSIDLPGPGPWLDALDPTAAPVAGSVPAGTLLRELPVALLVEQSS